MATTPVNTGVLIADSQFLITESLQHILQQDSRYYVFGVAVEKKELVRLLTEKSISILLIDPSFIDLTGLPELKEIITPFTGLKILVLTNSITKNEMVDLNRMGINNVMLKTAGREELFEALSSTMAGKKFYSSELLDLLFEPTDKKGPGEETGQLTATEMEVVRLIAEGLTTKEIAQRKYISIHTVITHRKNIFRKLGVTSVSELIMLAVRSGWISLIEYHI
jgi:DNA-binding NarL/FixJ family response regulator